MDEKHYPDVNLNLNVRGLSQSATLVINDICRHLLKDGKRVFKLGLGQSPFPVPEPVVEELRANAHQKDYLSVKGLPALQSAVANYYRRTQNLDRTDRNVLIGPGSKELMFLLQLVYYGDLVITTPSWVSYAPQAKIIGRHIRWLPTYFHDKWNVTPDEIEDLCRSDPDRPRIVILNYPNNPSGITYTDEQLKAIADMARKYRLVFLSDEIYGELNFDGQHKSIAQFYPEGTIISSGLSKWCGAGGWRLGTFTFPDSLTWLLDAMAVVASETYTSTSAPIQYAAVRAFKGGRKIEEYLFQTRRVLKTLAVHITDLLMEAGALLHHPSGGFYIFPNFEPFREKLNSKGIYTSPELCKELLEQTGVAILPGTDFGREPEELTARIAFVDFDGAKVLTAAFQVPPYEEITVDFIKTYCSNVVKAIEVLCEWLHSF